LQNVITFLPGFVENKQLSSLLAAADLVVFPYTHIYQSGAVLLAMSFGKPVLVTDIDGFREYVRDGQTGWLTDTSSATLFAAAMDNALQNVEALADVGRAARRACDTDFSWPHIAQTIVQKLYRGKP
jgi:glycosyltransferase involved in cell wall biosynthesis